MDFSRHPPGIRERRWGRIISAASSGVEQTITRLALCNGICSAVIGWSKTLGAEVAADGVTVNVLLPGRIHPQRVDELDTAATSRPSKSLEEIAAESAAGIPIGRYGRPEEFAAVAVSWPPSPRHKQREARSEWTAVR